jgi:phosphoribosyl-ATP pyrophosphohydrolase
MNSESRIARLEAVIAARRQSGTADSYVASLFAKGREKIAQKVGEEATETVIAAVSGDAAQLTAEAADLVFHLLVLLADAGLDFDAVLAELDRREGVSGIDEKAARKF